MIIAIGRLETDCADTNLAELCKRASRSGADEVHLHTLASSSAERRIVELDLASGLLASIGGRARPRLA
jgi:hypothetical protein